MWVTVIITIVCLFILVLFGLLASKEAERQKRSSASWFLLGMLFNINAFISLKLSRNAEEEAHSQSLWTILGLFFGIFGIIAFESGLNAENKGHDFDCWVILGFCLGIFSLLVSCFVKPFEPLKTVSTTTSKNTSPQIAVPETANTWKCHKCGQTNNSSKLFCSNCGTMKLNK